MIKKYQKDPDTSDEENEEDKTQPEEMDMEPAENTKLTETKSVKVVKKGRPKESKTKDPEELYLTSEQIEKYILDKYSPKYLAGKIPVSDVKKMQPTRVKPPVSDEKKQALIEQLKRGRETIQKNKILRKEQQIKEVEELKKKSIIVPNPVYVRKQKKKKGLAPAPPAPATKNLEPNLYPETEEESETTDTREIRKTKEKIKMIQATTKPTINYSQLSILEKLRSKF
jgi:hypothetical protein